MRMIINNKNKLIPILALTFLLLSLMPIIITGLNARPYMDDLAFAGMSSFFPPSDANHTHYIERSVRSAVLDDSFFGVLRAVGYTVIDNYHDWQGTYSALALFSIHPGVLFGEEAYPLTMLFTLGALLFSTALLCRTVICKNRLMYFVGFSFLMTQFLPSVPQGFFWWNGAVYYTMFYSLMLINLSVKIRLIRKPELHFIKKLAIIASLDFFISGGNFITALLNAELSICVLSCAVYKSVSAGNIGISAKRRLPLALGTCFLLQTVGLLLSVLAPGNAIRQSRFITHPNAMQAIFRSIQEAFIEVGQFTTIVIIATLVLSIPFLWKLSEHSQHGFRLPALVVAVSFLLFASAHTPPIYALSFAGEKKIANIYYFLYLWFIFGNAYYITGWLRQHLKPQPSLIEKRIYYISAFLFAAASLVVAFHTSGFAVCLGDLRSGEINNFMQEYNNRLDILRSDETVLSLEHFSSFPSSLVPWGRGERELDTQLYEIYYRKSNISAPPQKTANATPNIITIVTDGREATVNTYLINDGNYCHLHSLAQALQSFDIDYTDSRYNIVTDVPYTMFGDASTPNAWALAYYTNVTVNINGIPHKIDCYDVNGETYFSLRNLAESLGYRVHVYDGKIWFD